MENIDLLFKYFYENQSAQYMLHIRMLFKNNIERSAIIILLDKLEDEGIIKKTEQSVLGSQTKPVWKITYNGINIYNQHFSFTEYLKSKNEKESKIQNLDIGLKEFEYDTRRWPLGISIASIIVSLGLGINSCVNDQSNKTEIESLKHALNSIKDTILIYKHQKTNSDTL